MHRHPHGAGAGVGINIEMSHIPIDIGVAGAVGVDMGVDIGVDIGVGVVDSARFLEETAMLLLSLVIEQQSPRCLKLILGVPLPCANGTLFQASLSM